MRKAVLCIMILLASIFSASAQKMVNNYSNTFDVYACSCDLNQNGIVGDEEREILAIDDRCYLHIEYEVFADDINDMVVKVWTVDRGIIETRFNNVKFKFSENQYSQTKAYYVSDFDRRKLFYIFSHKDKPEKWKLVVYDLDVLGK